jgi:hypothetical protein
VRTVLAGRMDELGPDKQPQDSTEKSLTLRVQWKGADSVPVTFANAFMCQRTPHEFVVTFAQLVPPPLESMAPEELQNLTEIPARVVFQVGISPHRMLELIETLQRNYDGYCEWLSRVAGEGEG